MVSDFPNSTDQPDEIALTIYLSGVTSRSSRKRPGNEGFMKMVRNFPPFRSQRKKRSTSEGNPQFPHEISGKLSYHLTSNRNFRIFWPNGEHPGFRLDYGIHRPGFRIPKSEICRIPDSGFPYMRRYLSPLRVNI